MARVLLTTFGSFGDLHPFLALACELRRRGHKPTIAASDIYQLKIEAAGIAFAPLRTAPLDIADRDLIRRALDLNTGPRYIIRSLLMPFIRESWQDTLAAARGQDLLVSHPCTFATRAVAEQLSLPWASTTLAPLGMFSPHDPPIAPPAEFLDRFRPLGPRFYAPIFTLAKRSTLPWTAPYTRLRRELGLPAIANPLFEGSYSPLLHLALFSPIFGAPQPDWPAQAVATGFPFYDHDGAPGLPPELDRFLDHGAPPIVFTLGTSAVNDAGSFFHHSLAAAQQLGRRAVLLTGKDPANVPPNLPATAIAVPYAPHSAVFPRSAAIVHQGGVGTTSQAMLASQPQLLLPYGVDQPDNADRVRRLGLARVITRRRYSAARAAAELHPLLTDPTYAANATRIGALIAHETGTATAVDHLEALL